MDFNVIAGSFVIVKDNTPKYVVPTSNCFDAYLLGVPCLVLKGPYQKEMENIYGRIQVRTVIDVKSCVSGLEYTIPYDWVEEYNSLVEANEHTQIIGHHFPEVRELIGKPYWPRDCSFITGLHRETWKTFITRSVKSSPCRLLIKLVMMTWKKNIPSSW